MGRTDRLAQALRLLFFALLAGCSRTSPPVGDAAPASREPLHSTRSVVADAATSSAPLSPTLRLLVLTDLAGELEPCGCSAATKGGFERLAAAVRALRTPNVPSLFVLVGHSFFDPTRKGEPPLQDRWEADALAELLRTLRVDVVLPSRLDRRLAGAQWTHWMQQLSSPPLLSDASDEKVREVDAAADGLRVARGGLQIELLGADLGGTKSRALHLTRLRERSAAARQRGAELVIALVNQADSGTGSEDLQTAADLTIEAGLLHNAPEVRSDLRVRGGQRGEQLVVLDLYQSGPKLPWSLASRYSAEAANTHNQLVYRAVPMTRDAPADPTVKAQLRALAMKINAYNASAQTRAGRTEPTSRYAGSEPCAACHTATYLAWKATPHAAAYATLQRLDKEYNLDCVGCHVTGYGKGGASLTHNEGFAHVGCESCHQASLAHVDNPMLHKPGPRREVSGHQCVQCHDAAHSPAFQEAEYRARLNAPGHRVPAL